MSSVVFPGRVGQLHAGGGKASEGRAERVVLVEFGGELHPGRLPAEFGVSEGEDGGGEGCKDRGGLKLRGGSEGLSWCCTQRGGSEGEGQAGRDRKMTKKQKQQDY